MRNERRVSMWRCVEIWSCFEIGPLSVRSSLPCCLLFIKYWNGPKCCWKDETGSTSQRDKWTELGCVTSPTDTHLKFQCHHGGVTNTQVTTSSLRNEVRTGCKEVIGSYRGDKFVISSGLCSSIRVRSVPVNIVLVCLFQRQISIFIWPCGFTEFAPRSQVLNLRREVGSGYPKDETVTKEISLLSP